VKIIPGREVEKIMNLNSSKERKVRNSVDNSS
jgi:hypothetical protein